MDRQRPFPKPIARGAVCRTYRNREWTLARSPMFGERDPTPRQRPIAMLTQGRYGHGCLLWRLPEDRLHPRGPFPLVCRHPFPRQHFGGKRRGAQALKGLHLSPSAHLCRLHDTRWEPTHHRMGVVPVDGLPVHRVAGDRTSRWCHGGHRRCLLHRFAMLSRDARPAWEVSPLARGGMVLLAPRLSIP
jgi:hypothetical protein